MNGNSTCSSQLELVFFFSWFVNRGSPHGMFPSHNAAIVVLLMTLSTGIALSHDFRSTKRWRLARLWRMLFLK